MRPEIIRVRPGRMRLPISQPQVVAIIQKNKRAQSKERIFEITSAAVLWTNLLLSFYRAGQKPADEVALQGEEYDQRDKHTDEGTCREQMPILAAVADNGCQLHGYHTYIWIGPEDDQRHQVVVPDP